MNETNEIRDITELKQMGKFDDAKVKFIMESYKNPKTRLTNYRLFFLYVYPFEIDNDKDYIDFSAEEKDQVLEAVGGYSHRTPKQVKSLLRTYEDYAIKVGFNTTGVNYITSIDQDYLNNFVDKNLLKKRFVFIDELLKIKEELETKIKYKDHYIKISGQDFAITLLLFYGIYGLACDEIINMKPEDIDFENKKITVRGENGERIVAVNDLLLNELKKATNEEGYEIYRKSSKKTTVFTKEFLESDYVFKTYVKNENNPENKISPVTVRNRGMKVLKLYEELTGDKSYSKVTLKSLIASGKIERLNQIKNENGKLTAQDFKNVMVEFGGEPNSYFILKEDYAAVFGEVE